MTDPRAALDGWRPIVGTVAEVAATVRATRAAGHCEAMTLPQRLPGGRVRVYVLDRGAVPVPAEPPRRRWLILAAAGAVGLAVTATIIVVVAAWAVGHWQQLAGAGLIALAVVLAWQRARR